MNSSERSVSNPGLLEKLEVSLFVGVEFASASSHDVTVARDSVSHVEVRDGIGEQSTAQVGVTRGLVGELVDAGRLDNVVTNEMGSELSQASADFIERVVGEGISHLFGKGTEDHPVITSVSRRAKSGSGLLDTTIGVCVGGLLLEVTGRRKDQVSVVDSLISSSSHVDHISVFGDILVSEVVGSHKEHNLGFGLGALLSGDSEVEGANLTSVGVENVNSVPGFSLVDDVGVFSDDVDVVLNSFAITTSEGLSSDNNHGEVSAVKSLTERMVSISDVLQGLSGRANVSVVVGQVVGRSDDGNFKSIDELGSTDTCVEHGAFELGVGADQDEEVCVINASNVRVHQILSTEVALELRGVTSNIDVVTVEFVEEILEGTDALNVLELSNAALDFISSDSL
jgi:hypothetical protein